MILIKPLDSSAFVPDTALPPASMQAGLRRNDEEAKIKAIRLPVCVYRFVVIPAKAGIQEGDDGVPQATMIQSELP